MPSHEPKRHRLSQLAHRTIPIMLDAVDLSRARHSARGGANARCGLALDRACGIRRVRGDGVSRAHQGRQRGDEGHREGLLTAASCGDSSMIVSSSRIQLIRVHWSF